MSQWTASVSAAHLARLLEPRPGARRRRPQAARLPRTGRRRTAAGARRPGPGRGPAARRAGAGARARASAGPPSRPRTRRCGPRASRGPGAAPAAGPRSPRATCCPPAAWSRCRRTPPGSVIDLGCAALPAPEPWLTRAMEGALAELPAYAATHGDFPAGLPVLREAIADRYTARGRADHARADHGDHRRDGRDRGRGPAGGRLRRAGRRRVAQLRQRARTVPRDRLPAGAGRAARRPGRLGHGRLAAGAAGRGAADGVRHAGLPQPHRHARRRRRSGASWWRRPGRPARWSWPTRRWPNSSSTARSRASRPMAAFDRGGTVMTVGSASKAVWAGLRIGWVRSTPDVVRRLVSARAYLDLGSPVVDQLAVAWLLRGGGWDAGARHPPPAGPRMPRRPRGGAARAHARLGLHRAARRHDDVGAHR